MFAVRSDLLPSCRQFDPYKVTGGVATEEGIVIAEGIQTAWVKTTRSSSCKSCSARNSCSIQDNGKSVHVEALNLAGARTGDQVVLFVEGGFLLKAAFLMYVFPIICMLAGALLGAYLAEPWGWSETSLSMLLAFGAFALSFTIVRFHGNRMARKDSYQPKIIKIVR